MSATAVATTIAFGAETRYLIWRSHSGSAKTTTGENLLRKAIATSVCTIALVGATGGAAFAGEITGKGKPTGGPAHANSICVFSGQNDDPGAPLDGSGPNGPGGRTQSFGQNVKLGLADPGSFNPGDACRGGSNPDRP
jgi:hypothetical protein